MPDYEVKVEGSKPVMVKAKNQASARNFVVRNKVTVAPLTTQRAIALGRDGQELLDAESDQDLALEPDDPPPPQDPPNKDGSENEDEAPQGKK